MDRRLLRQLEPVARRYRRWKMWSLLACLWILLAATAGVALWSNVEWGWYSPWTSAVLAGLALCVAVGLALAAGKMYRDYKWIAQQIENEFPELDSTLLTAVEIHDTAATDPTGQFAQYGFLQTQVIHGVLAHAYKSPWKKTLSGRWLAVTHLFHWTMLAGAVAALCCLAFLAQPMSDEQIELARKKRLAASGKTVVSIEPGNKEVERNSSLVVLARFEGKQPEEVTLVTRNSKGEETEYNMTRSMDDPIYAFQMMSISREFDYFVRFDQDKSAEYRIDVFENPSLVRADAHLKYPKFANESDKLVEDFRHVAAVEGTTVTVKCKLNKPVNKATLIDEDGNEHPLELAGDTQLYQLKWVVKETRRLVLQLEDEDGRTNSDPPKLVVRATPNRRPTVKLKSPRDVQVSPLEEFLVQASFWDDFGLSRFGVTLNFNGRQQEVVLGKSQPKASKPNAEHLLDFESLQAKPDQLLTYHFWAEDIGSDGKPRRTNGDMFFAEVRPFEEIYRQGQQPPGGGQQQQRNRQGGQGQQQGQGARLAQLQKQIITATWNLVRRYDESPVDARFKPDTKVVGDSQIEALTQATQAGSRVQDVKAKEHLNRAIKHMKDAAELLTETTTSQDKEKLRPALRAEQAAYRSLLHLRNREHRVIRQQQRRNQQSGSPSGGQRNNRQQRMLQQLELKNNRNRYETQRAAQQQQQNNSAQQKNRELLNRLKELTRRQEDLNKQIQDLKTALQTARTEQEREELRRQLKRLRDEQKDIMRDTDKLANRMDQSTDPEQAAEAQRRLDKTRQDQRRAAESLDKGKLSQAAASGSRAERDLKDLRDDIRRKSANQFAEDMKSMRNRAQDIVKRQEEIRDRMAGGSDQKTKKSLRSKGGRESTTEKLRKQSKQLGDLLNRMKGLVEKSEQAEPLLSDRLYDAWRKATQDKLANNADLTRQLLERGFVDQATKSEKPLNDGVKQLKKGIDRAARTVLGDETQALKQAKDELQKLHKELEDESNRATGKPGQQASPDGKKSGKATGKQRSQQDSKSRGSGRNKQGGKQKSRQSPRGGQRSKDGKKGRGKQRGSKAGGGKQRGSKAGKGKRRSGQGDSRGRPDGKQRGGGLRQDSQQRNKKRQPGGRRPGRPNGDPNRLGGLANLFDENTRPRAPLQGGDYREWSNRLRDVEEILENPDLRNQANRIREQMRELRKDVKRHSKSPNWELVQKNILGPLNELRKQIQEEILRKEPDQKLVPLDRDPVPKEFEDKVRRYFRRLGGEK